MSKKKRNLLVSGIHYLKYAFDENDESVVEAFLENPYGQYFYGCEYFRDDLPIDPSSMSRWREKLTVLSFLWSIFIA